MKMGSKYLWALMVALLIAACSPTPTTTHNTYNSDWNPDSRPPTALETYQSCVTQYPPSHCERTTGVSVRTDSSGNNFLMYAGMFYMMHALTAGSPGYGSNVHHHYYVPMGNTQPTPQQVEQTRTNVREKISSRISSGSSPDRKTGDDKRSSKISSGSEKSKINSGSDWAMRPDREKSKISSGSQDKRDTQTRSRDNSSKINSGSDRPKSSSTGSSGGGSKISSGSGKKR